MGFLDNLSKAVSQSIDRAKFEAEKFQKATRLQNEIGELKREIDTRKIEFADRALDLYRAGKIQSPTLAEIVKAMEALQSSVTLKEEELKATQAEIFVEPTPPVGTPAQHVPVSAEPPTPTQAQATTVQSPTTSGMKQCPNCRFQMPAAAMFCPNCGARVGV